MSFEDKDLITNFTAVAATMNNIGPGLEMCIRDRYSGNKFMSVDEVKAGQICAVTGFEKTYPGMGIGIETNSEMPVLEPVMTYKVTPQENDDIHKLYDDMKTLEQEEPRCA